jgi:hypothetical protein
LTGGARRPLRFPSSESDESSSWALSFMRFGERVEPGAHQKRFFSTLSSASWSSRAADEPAAWPRALPRVEVWPNARLAK